MLHELESRYTLPSRKYLVANILPQVHTSIKSWVKSAISQACFLSFTTVAWSSERAVASLLSLTAHWLTDMFQGEYLAEVYRNMLDGWEIGDD